MGNYESQFVQKDEIVAERVHTYSTEQLAEIVQGGKPRPEVTEALIEGNAARIAELKPRNAVVLAAIAELSRRQKRTGVRLGHPADAFNMLRGHGASRQERFWCLDLSGAHELIEIRLISHGLVNRTVVHSREVFSGAIQSNAVAVIVAHNHPSGMLEPSPEDIEITKRLAAAGRIIGIQVLDHIVFSASGYVSMNERGMVPLGDD